MDLEEENNFTDDEIRYELSKLGYNNVPDQRLKEFKKDLKVLIRHEYSKESSQNNSMSSHPPPDTSTSIGGFPHSYNRSPLEESQQRSTTQDSWRIPNHQGGKENRYDIGIDPILRKPLGPAPKQIGGNFSMYDSTTDTSQHQHRDDVSDTDTERRMVKRKVLRKKDDGSKVIDESMSDIGSILDLDERLRDLGIDDERTSRRPQSSREVPPYRLAPDDQRPASVILRSAKHPHTKNLRKSDPVARFQQFQQSWSQQKAPGEKVHKNLRWNIREHMLNQDQVLEKKSQRVFVPNKYVVPTDKKRRDLRWQIRMDIAQGQMPPHGFYHEY
ncbi:centriolar and ciliogenesis-associated protein HYLS1-like [Ylistrum balloti]|uniref:centriolar and ciliogenesis-associated protein HYLS1-like n=1 Tax=Ylistrum balloti TaxID=509963 RepID=UPI0029057FE3|nr:centriolar and ciliogenesis-associated protein HYLS1-like [Ylistrum balloti]